VRFTGKVKDRVNASKRSGVERPVLKICGDEFIPRAGRLAPRQGPPLRPLALSLVFSESGGGVPP